MSTLRSDYRSDSDHLAPSSTMPLQLSTLETESRRTLQLIAQFQWESGALDLKLRENHCSNSSKCIHDPAAIAAPLDSRER
jgi:hypothetical protein